MASFKPNREFRRQYDKLFRRDPLAANTFLLLAELADQKGQIVTSEEELVQLLSIRFEDPHKEYAL